jgi:mannose-6-phosphate isomerase-like protein (cupin superfamily)
MLKRINILLLVLFFASCSKTPDNFFSDEEKKAPLVLKEVYRDNTKSSHIILMNGAEKPHFHDKHSFEVVLVKGANRLHLGDKVFELTPDKPVRVEKGELHWAENVGRGYSILNVDFYPPFDGTDRRFLK